MTADRAYRPARRRAGWIVLAVGAVFAVAGIVLPFILGAAFVSYPGGTFDQTTSATGSFTLLVDPATLAPQPPRSRAAAPQPPASHAGERRRHGHRAAGRLRTDRPAAAAALRPALRHRPGVGTQCGQPAGLRLRPGQPGRPVPGLLGQPPARDGHRPVPDLGRRHRTVLPADRPGQRDPGRPEPGPVSRPPGRRAGLRCLPDRAGPAGPAQHTDTGPAHHPAQEPDRRDHAAQRRTRARRPGPEHRQWHHRGAHYRRLPAHHRRPAAGLPAHGHDRLPGPRSTRHST